MTAPAYVGAGSYQAAAGGTDITVPWPAGHQVGQIGILVVQNYNQAAFSFAGGVDGGFVNKITVAGGTPTGVDTCHQTGIFWCRATSTSMTSPVIQNPDHAGASDYTHARIYTISGCISTGDPFDDFAGNADTISSVNCTIPGVTTTVADCLIALIVAGARDNATSGFNNDLANANLTGIGNYTSVATALGNGGNINFATATMASAGATGNTTGTFANAQTKGVFCLALKPEPPAAGVFADSFDPSRAPAPHLLGQRLPMALSRDFIPQLPAPQADWWEPVRLPPPHLLVQRLPMAMTREFAPITAPPPYADFVSTGLQGRVVFCGSGTFEPEPVPPPIATYVSPRLPGRYVLTGGGTYKPAAPPPPPEADFIAPTPWPFSVAGNLYRARVMFAGSGVAYPALNYLDFSGTIVAQSSLPAAHLDVDRHLAAVIASASALAGAIAIDRRLGGASVGDAAGAAAVAIDSRLAAVAAGILAGQGALQPDRDLGGDIASQGAQVLGAMFGERALRGFIAGQSVLTAHMAVTAPLGGAFAAAATFQGALRRFFPLEGGTIAGASSVGPALLVRGKVLSGEVAGVSQVLDALLQRDARLLGQVLAEGGPEAAFMALQIVLRGQFPGRSRITGFLRQLTTHRFPPFTREDGGGHAFVAVRRGVRVSTGGWAGKVAVVDWTGKARDADEEDD